MRGFEGLGKGRELEIFAHRFGQPFGQRVLRCQLQRHLRGAVLPVIDLAARLGWKPTEATPRNPIIVIEHLGQMRGLIVHDVADIVSIEAGTLQQPDAMGHETITHFLEGIAPLGEDMVMVLNLTRLMADEPIELAA